MVAVTVGFAVLALLLTVGGGLLLYLFVRSEHDWRTVTDRETAEQLARRDGGGDDDGTNEDAEERSIEGNHWG